MNLRRLFIYVLVLLGSMFLIVVVLSTMGRTVNNTFNSISNSLPDQVPPETSTNVAITSPPNQPEELSLQQQFQAIDQSLSNAMQSSMAYNSPDKMQLDETLTIELLINPSKAPTELQNQVTESGTVVTATIEITPHMRAELTAADQDAFLVQPIHTDPEQLIGSTETTRWAWQITAKKGGTQKLTLVVYRLVNFEGKEYWREVQTYKSDIDVNVSFAQQLKLLDWKWIVGTILTAIIVPAFWRWLDNRQKESKPAETGKGKETTRRKTNNKKM